MTGTNILRCRINIACIQTSGVNARVHEGCHAEVGQDEEEDQAIVERHSGRDHLCQPGAPGDTKEETAEVRLLQSHTSKWYYSDI